MLCFLKTSQLLLIIWICNLNWERGSDGAAEVKGNHWPLQEASTPVDKLRQFDHWMAASANKTTCSQWNTGSAGLVHSENTIRLFR